jgi:hypothetical protein
MPWVKTVTCHDKRRVWKPGMLLVGVLAVLAQYLVSAVYLLPYWLGLV